jgi:AcrR family transcriptional regulator
LQVLKIEIEEKIRRSALMEFQAKGFRYASMREIARNAGIASGNIYRYFSGKRHLFVSLIDPVFEKLMISLKEIKNANRKEACIYEFGDGSFDTRTTEINKIAATLIETCEEYHTELYILMEKSQGSGIPYENVKTVFIDLMEDILKKTLLPNILERGYKKVSEDIAHVLSTAFIFGLSDILTRHRNVGDVRFLMNQIITIFFKDIFQRL